MLEYKWEPGGYCQNLSNIKEKKQVEEYRAVGEGGNSGCSNKEDLESKDLGKWGIQEVGRRLGKQGVNKSCGGENTRAGDA